MSEILYRAPSDAAAMRAAVAVLSESGTTAEGGEALASRIVWLDTFDWRLASRERVLLWTGDARGGQLRFGTVDGETLRSIGLAKPPRWASDVPASPLRDDLERWISPRCLEGLAEGRRRGRRWSLRDPRRKTIATLTAETLRVRPPGDGRFAATLHLVRVVPVRGYDRQAARLGKRLAKWSERGEAGGLEKLAEPLFAVAMEAVGRVPCDYSSRFFVELDPDMRADRAMVELHRHLYSKIVANHAGAVADLDPEYLHDLRVSVRRTRSLLAQVRGVFPKRSVESFKKGFRWVQQVTGPMRDLHVWRLDMPELAGRLEPRARVGLAVLERHLGGRLEREHRRLGSALSGRRYAELLRRWHAFLERPLPTRTSLPNATRPVREVAAGRILRVYRKMVHEGSTIDGDSPPERLHALRLRGKKLRYLLEAFRSVFPPSIEDEIRGLKRLQDHLGDFNDCANQRSAVERFHADLAASSALTSDVEVTLAALLADADQRAERLRGQFHSEFEKFAAPRRQRAFEDVMKDEKRKGKKTRRRRARTG